MSRPPTPEWQEASQQHLLDTVAELREALERHRARTEAPGAAPAERTSTPPLPPPLPPGTPSTALSQLGAIFRLSRFEQNLLVLCAGLVLDARIGPLCAAAQGDPDLAYPTFGLALALLPEPKWSAFLPDSPLRHWRLIEVGAGRALTAAPLRIDEWALHFLMGMPHVDARLAPLVERVEPGRHLLPPSQEALAKRLAATWQTAAQRAAGSSSGVPVVQLLGDGSADVRAVAALACAETGLELYALDARVLPASPGELGEFLRLWQRQTLVTPAALLIDGDPFEIGDGGRDRALAQLIEGCAGPLLLAGRERRQTTRRPFVTIELPPLLTLEKLTLWRGALGSAAERLDDHDDRDGRDGRDGRLSHLAAQFNLAPTALETACAESLASGGDLGAALWDSCRRQARPRLDDLAQRIEPGATWDDLALPEAQLGILRDIAVQVRHRATVYETWGFGPKGGRGLGISALFAGPSGTGKTFAAEVLAAELRLDLYRIDLSAVVSKYIGETEKNLRRVFDAAESGGAILLFDEADALFGKRSEVKDSHDRHANIEVSYLLQRMEAYRGLAILTTNLKDALDPAFLRRLRFVVRFPFPDAPQRAAIWRRIFPRDTPTAALDIDRLAQLNVSGAHIRNIALHAAFLAADAGEAVGMKHLFQAAHGEYRKLERALTDAELAGWTR